MHKEHSGEYNIFDVVKLPTWIICLKGNKSRNLSVVEMSIIFLQRRPEDVQSPIGRIEMKDNVACKNPPWDKETTTTTLDPID